MIKVNNLGFDVESESSNIIYTSEFSIPGSLFQCSQKNFRQVNFKINLAYKLPSDSENIKVTNTVYSYLNTLDTKCPL